MSTPDEATGSRGEVEALAREVWPTLWLRGDAAGPSTKQEREARVRWMERVVASDWLAQRDAAQRAEALREAARDLPGFDDIRTHGDAANWLRDRANRIGGQP